MAHSTKQPPAGAPALLRHPLVLPGILLLFAFLFLISGAGGMATGFLLAALGTALYTEGKARRWKGAPGAGLLVAAVGAILALASLLR